MNVKTIFMTGALVLTVCGAQAQLTLDRCHEMARDYYPQIRQYDLIEKTREYNLANANRGYLPQFSLSAQATYQSDVPGLPVSIPGINFQKLPKDQYQNVIDLNQNIWDGGNIRAQKVSANAAADTDLQQLAVDLYALNDRVNQLFFGILLLDEQLVQNGSLLDELQRNHIRVEASIANGVANQADLDAVKVDQLTTLQNRVDLETTRKAYREMLGLMIGQSLDENTHLLKPDLLPHTTPREIKRPELFLFDMQHRQLDAQEQTIQAKNMPRLGIFAQGGYGNPGLNLLKNGFTFYYLAGVKLTWNFGTLYTKRNEQRLVGVNRDLVETRREIFLYNTNLEVTQTSREIDKLVKQMKDDDEIIALRANIVRSAQAKVANGTMSVLDMLREVTNEDLARQNKILHEMQLLLSIYNLKNTTNN